MPIIAVEGMKFYAYHGYYPEERLIGGFYLVDVYLQTNFETAAQNDALEGTINYETVFDVCKRIMAEPVKLLEHLAEKLLTALKTALNRQILDLKVRVSKLNPPLNGIVGRTFVELERSW